MHEPLAEWASLRNVIVHTYTKLDLERLYEAYTTKLEVLRKFRALAAASLGWTAAPGGGSPAVREKRVPWETDPGRSAGRRGPVGPAGPALPAPRRRRKAR
jgi:hypothetical protein